MDAAVNLRAKAMGVEVTHQFNRVLIVDAQRGQAALLQKAVSAALDGTVVDIAENQECGAALLAQYRHPLALIDAQLPNGAGFALIARVRGGERPAHPIATARRCDEVLLRRALRAGAEGFLLKDEPTDDLALRLRNMARGYPPLSPLAARQLIRGYARGGNEVTLQSELSPKELDVLAALAAGHKLKETAGRLGVSYNTAATHVRRVYSKLNISTRAEAAVAAMRIGLL